MSELNRCYVYVHELCGVIVYIGIGVGCRIVCKSGRTNVHLTEWDNLVKYKVAENLTRDEAHKLEQDLLDKHFNSGTLYNVQSCSARVNEILYADVSYNFIYDETSPSKLLHARDKYSGKYDSVVVARCGDPAGGFDCNVGYYRVRMNGKLFTAHRLIYCLINKIDLPVNLVIDHIDTNRTNNNISNLRLTDTSSNNRNRQHKESNTGYQCIRERVEQRRFSVRYNYNYVRHTEMFSYTPTRTKRSRNHHPTREAALEAALEYRNKLVDDGLIILTGK